jgi:hypothetical protein
MAKKRRKKPLTALITVCLKVCRKFRVKRKGRK